MLERGVGPNGAMFVKSDQVAEKLIRIGEDLDLDCFMLHLPWVLCLMVGFWELLNSSAKWRFPKYIAYFCYEKRSLKNSIG